MNIGLTLVEHLRDANEDLRGADVALLTMVTADKDLRDANEDLYNADEGLSVADEDLRDFMMLSVTKRNG